MKMPIDELEKMAITALEEAYKVHEKLGPAGEEIVQKNQYGETALKMDIEAEKAIIATLKKANFPIRMISEEHGTTEITENPTYLGVLDGLDGSIVYKKARGKGRYGTMLGIFSNLDPKYDDYLFCGVIEHSTKRLFYATKNKGSFVISNGKRKQIFSSKCSVLDKNTRIYADELFDKSFKITFIYDTFLSKLQDHNILHENASASHYVDLAEGNADLVLECTRKGNLEIAVAYGLLNEARGVMVSDDGVGLGQRKYLKFGQDKLIPIISASNMVLASKLLEHIS